MTIRVAISIIQIIQTKVRLQQGPLTFFFCVASIEQIPSMQTFDLLKDIQTTLLHSVSRTVNMLAQISHFMMKDKGLVPAHRN